MIYVLLYYCIIIFKKLPLCLKQTCMHQIGSFEAILRCILLLAFLALPKPCSRASWWASSFVPSCNWTRKWLVKMSSSSAAAMSAHALSSMRATAVPSPKNPRIVCYFFAVLSVSERCQTEIAVNAGPLQQGSSGRISSVIDGWGARSRTVRRASSVFVCGTESAFSASL